jgi:hypothetical protein
MWSGRRKNRTFAKDFSPRNPRSQRSDNAFSKDVVDLAHEHDFEI